VRSHAIQFELNLLLVNLLIQMATALKQNQKRERQNIQNCSEQQEPHRNDCESPSGSRILLFGI
jgi:hypothetical protein